MGRMKELAIDQLNNEEALARIDIRLSKQHKELFKKAARLAGFKTLSSFILSVAVEKAIDIIINKQEVITNKT